MDLVGRSGANVFLFPSIWPETFSYVAEELMQLHVPLMCFNLGAPAERVGRYDRGRVIDFKGIPELLDALIAFHRQIEQGNATTPRLNHGLGTVKEEIKW